MSMHMAAIVLIFAATIMAMAFIAIWAPRKVHVRLTAVTLAVTLVLLSPIGLASILGKPRPMGSLFSSIINFLSGEKSGRVVSAILIEDVAIYVWLVPEEADKVPTSLEFPWDKKVAEELQRTLEQERSGEGGGAMLKYEPSLDFRKAPQVYPLPVAPLPEKDEKTPPVLRYDLPV